MKKGLLVSIVLILICLLFAPPMKKTEASNEDNKIKYYDVKIKGEVLRPDIYNVPDGTEVLVVIKLAGGNDDSVYLEEGELVHKNMTIEVKARVKNPININHAKREEIASLPGIGDKTLDKIMIYLKDNFFNSWSDFSKISGIKNGKLLEIKARAII